MCVFNERYCYYNRIYDKIIDRDWFSALSSRGCPITGVDFLYLDTHVILHVNYARFNGFCFAQFSTFMKSTTDVFAERTSQKSFLIPQFVIDTINW